MILNDDLMNNLYILYLFNIYYFIIYNNSNNNLSFNILKNIIFSMFNCFPENAIFTSLKILLF